MEMTMAMTRETPTTPRMMTLTTTTGMTARRIRVTTTATAMMTTMLEAVTMSPMMRVTLPPDDAGSINVPSLIVGLIAALPLAL